MVALCQNLSSIDALVISPYFYFLKGIVNLFLIAILFDKLFVLDYLFQFNILVISLLFLIFQKKCWYFIFSFAQLFSYCHLFIHLLSIDVQILSFSSLLNPLLIKYILRFILAVFISIHLFNRFVLYLAH
jgi:hypothetical protein